MPVELTDIIGEALNKEAYKNLRLLEMRKNILIEQRKVG